LADGVRFVRRVRRGLWEQEPFDVDNVLADFYDESVRGGRGLSLWRVTTASDEDAVTAILAIGDKAPSRGPIHVIDIPAALLDEEGLAPHPTPGGTSNSHARAPELHHDVSGLDEQACRRLCAALGQNRSGLLRSIRGAHLRPLMEKEAANFQEAADAERAKKR
jgi:hypothetical protein